jgi:predicted dehydrogenase
MIAATMATYGIGILGAGWVAGEYVRVCSDHPLTEIVGAYNRTPGKAAALLAEHGVDGREHSSDDELFEDDRVHVVVSCTPPNPRPGHIAARPRPDGTIVIEKPIALTTAEVEEARRAVAEDGVRTVTSFVLRWLGGEIAEIAAFGGPPRRNPDYESPPNVVRLFGTAGTLQNNRVYSSRHYPGSLG